MVETAVENVEQEKETLPITSFPLTIHLPSLKKGSKERNSSKTNVEKNSKDAEKKEILNFQVFPTTVIQDIRQHIYDSPNAQFFTCFSLSLTPDGPALNEWMELSQVEGLENELYLVCNDYSHHEVRVHINRLREITNYYQSPHSVYGIDPSVSLAYTISPGALTAEIAEPSDADETKKKPLASKQEIELLKKTFSNIPEPNALDLACRYPSNETISKEQVKCLESITFSKWHPVPAFRRMAGDLMYLSIHTLEDQVLEVTCAASGFFINSSTPSTFNPEKAKKHHSSHTIFRLLEAASPLFKQNLATVQDYLRSIHPFEFMPVTTPTFPWCAKKASHTADATRSLDAYFIGSEALETVTARDWNDDIQTAFELPRESAHERVTRDQALVRAHADFVDAAIKGVMAIIDKSLVPINPLEEDSSQMYVHNNIFFSHGYDKKETFDLYGGQDAAHVAIGKDINGIQAIQGLDLDNVHTLGTVLVDYKGQRVLAQSIVPGILRKSKNAEESSIQYGSVDGGLEIKSNPEFAESAKKVAKLLHLSEHVLVDSEQNNHSLFTSLETKWIKGTDSRNYILDLYRTCPVDATFLEKVEKEESTNPYPHKMVLLRHELIELYYEHKLRAAIQEYQKKVAADKEQAEKEGKPAKTVEEINAEFAFSMTLNPDAFTAVQDGSSESQIKLDQEAIRDASGFMAVSISQMVMDFVQNQLGIPVDSEGLVKSFHRRGINMRYLGQVAELFDKMDQFPIECFKGLLVEEMVARLSKRLLRGLLQNVPLYQTGRCISHFFNCLFTDSTAELQKSAPKHEFESLTSSRLHQLIEQGVKSRFRYDLPADFWKKRQITLLRSICQKVGIQVEAKEYPFTTQTKNIFAEQDILNLYPIIKTAIPKAKFASEAMEHGRLSVSQGEKEAGLEIMRESLSMYEQIYGPVHLETGHAYASMAMLLFNFGQLKQAILLQRHALIVAERCVGFDFAETIQQYMNLAYYEYSAGNPVLGLKYMKYALSQWRLLDTATHPDTASIYSNIGAMLQKLDQHDLAIKFMSEALEMNLSLIGPESEAVAVSNDLLTKAYFLKGDFRSALSCQRAVHKYYKTNLGDKDERTKSCSNLMKHLTARAVEVAKKNKAVVKG